MSDKKRVDLLLIKQGICSSREKAQALIMAGCIYNKEIKILKPSEKVEENTILSVRDKPHQYVGRGALKLEKAIKVFNARIQDKIIVDIGAATGGFTDVLLKFGAKHVYAVDVGYGQFDWELRNNKRVTLLERTNARYLENSMFQNQPDIAVMDVSFISTKLIIPVIKKIIVDKGISYILIKPQFEAGRENVGKHGVVKEPKIHVDVILSIFDFTKTIGMTMTKLDYSPITGPKGNIEYICEIISDDNICSTIDEDYIRNIVNEAHASF